MRWPVSQTLCKRTHTVLRARDARHPLRTRSDASQLHALRPLVTSLARQVYPSVRWCLLAPVLRHERQVMMCHAGMIFLPPGTHMYLTCMSARLEGTWSTTDYELHGVPKARVNLGPDRTVCVVARSS